MSLCPRALLTSRLFLAALLDALAASVQRALAASLLGQLLASLLVCRKPSAPGRGVLYPHPVATQHTCCCLELEGLVLVILLDDLLLGLLVVNGVGTRW